jgi:hypothetical protein
MRSTVMCMYFVLSIAIPHLRILPNKLGSESLVPKTEIQVDNPVEPWGGSGLVSLYPPGVLAKTLERRRKPAPAAGLGGIHRPRGTQRKGSVPGRGGVGVSGPGTRFVGLGLRTYPYV